MERDGGGGGGSLGYTFGVLEYWLRECEGWLEFAGGGGRGECCFGSSEGRGMEWDGMGSKACGDGGRMGQGRRIWCAEEVSVLVGATLCLLV